MKMQSGIFRIFLSVRFLRETNFGESKHSKKGISAIFEALNFDFYELWHFLEAKTYTNKQFRAFEIAKMAIYELLDSPKSISRKK